MPILTMLLACPLVGILVSLCLPRNRADLHRFVALVATAAAFLLATAVTLAYRPDMPGLQFQEQFPWIPQLNVTYHLGVDGISVPMVFLTGLLGFLACLASATIAERQKEYYILYQLLVLGMLGTFVALDLFLFYVFWELVLVPMYFLIGIWGGGRREYSAFKFFVYTLAGSLAMLLAILTLFLMTGTFDMIALTSSGPGINPIVQRWLFLAFFLAFAIKVPVFPFHTWLPDAHVDAPTPISVILAGVLLKMGGYGFFRIAYPVLPSGATWFGGLMAFLGVVGIVYGAFVAMAQTDLKKLVAYSSVSHMGFVVLGLASFTPEGLHGAMFTMFSHGLVTGAMFLLVGVLYERAHTRDLAAFGGLGVRIPVFAGLFTFFGMASLGLPGLSGFVGEFLSLVGAYRQWPVHVAIAVIGIVATAAYTLTAVQRVLLGPLNEKWKAMTDASPREILSMAPLLLLVLVLGVYPLFLLTVQDDTLVRLLRHMIGG